MKVLVTGACGRVGAHVLRQLHGTGIQAQGLDAQLYPGNLREMANKVKLTLLDIQDTATLMRFFDREAFTHVIHLAAAIGDRFEAEPWLSYAINFGGTLNILEAARFSGVRRVVMASTHQVYAKVPGPSADAVTEDEPTDPTSVYAVMKLACEHMGRIYAENHGVETAFVRFSSYYSPERARLNRKTLNQALDWLIISALEQGGCELEWDADYVFDPVYIKDCAKGVILAASSKRSMSGRVYNIGGGRAVRLHEAAAAVMRQVSGSRITLGQGSAAHLWRPPCLSIRRAEQELGYAPSSLEDGIADCIGEVKSLADPMN